RLEAGAFDDLDARAVGPCDVKEVNRRTVGELERARLARELDALPFQHRLGLGDGAHRAPADVIDRASLAGHRGTFRRDDVHGREPGNACVLHRIDLTFELRALAAELG